MSMTSAPDLATVAHALANQARATMILTLLDGRAWTLTELAFAAQVARPTASEHVDRLVAAGLVEEVRQGRHRYVRISDGSTAETIEALAALSKRVRPPAPTLRAHRADRALREGRSCYRHLAGRLGVALCDGMISQELISADWTLTEAGRNWVADIGLMIPSTTGSPGSVRRRPFLRPCLDWTERRDHLAGALADQMFDEFCTRGWLRRTSSSRAVELTASGRVAIGDVLTAEVSRARDS
ncbi:winged helix-turn-helix domain-containing protein [Nocardioides panacihumi]